MAVRRARHDVFRATLRIDELVPIESHWTFRAYDDQTLTVEVQRPADWRERQSLEGQDLERLEREIPYSYVAYDGTAESLASLDNIRPMRYTCAFFLAKCGPEGESWTVRFTGRLHPTQGFVGQWEHDSHQSYQLWQPRFEDIGALEVPPSSAWSASIEPVGATLEPLTTGSYSLEGSLVDDENYGFIVPISVEFSLLPDRTLAGTCTSWGSTRDDGKPETATLSGSWTRNSIDMAQHFEFPNAPNELFAFHGRVSPYGITGMWSVVELVDMEDWEDSERQRFHLRATKMQRPWSPDEHALFPDCFRAAVRLLLLSSLRINGSGFYIPSALWSRVLVFCDSEWFHDDGV